MNVSALRTKKAAGQNSLGVPEPDVIPLGLSLAIWIMLAAATWAAIFFAGSVFL